MSTAQTKMLAWTAALVAGVAMAGYVAWHLSRLEEVRALVPNERLQQVLQSARLEQETATQRMPFQLVNGALIQADWSGKPAPVEKPREKPPPPPPPTRLPMTDLVKVYAVVVDLPNPERSKAVLGYLPAAKVTLPGGQTNTEKFTGAELDGALRSVKVAKITPHGVEFEFTEKTDEGEERENEVVSIDEGWDPSDFMVVVDDSGVIQKRAPGVLGAIPRTDNYGKAPAQTLQLGPDRFRIGTEDAEYFNENYAKVLSEEVRTRRYRDPATGRYAGIEITAVQQNSRASAHGVQKGDVILSINGEPVSSEQEVVSFVKNNQDMYDRWEVEVLSLGRRRTITYMSPKK